jgi:uncharacterized repeat protein (TIGR04076 family)
MKYSLFDLEIITIGDPSTFNCSHKVGDSLIVQGENISFKEGTEKFSHYALAALTPFIAAKQRATQTSDWMYNEAHIACPDPHCGALFEVRRLQKRTYDYNRHKDI